MTMNSAEELLLSVSWVDSARLSMPEGELCKPKSLRARIAPIGYRCRIVILTGAALGSLLLTTKRLSGWECAR